MKVGIITMHKPISYGSALQAYALQRTVEKLGYDVEIIDYKYPNELHYSVTRNIRYYFQIFVSYCINMLFGFSNIRKSRKFSNFWNQHFKLSNHYPTADSLVENPPKYDIYVTGSDQVWNANFTKGDTSFLLSFIDKSNKKIAYSSSFAINHVPIKYKDNYKKYLSEYNAISVRENTSVELVKDILGINVPCVCDPTLLLNRDDWDAIASQSLLKTNKPYILVFMLGYSFNPFPEANYIIDEIQDRLNMDVVCLDGDKSFLLRKNTKLIRSAGPEDFVNLVRGASYIITSSFHGVVFSTIYEKPFTAVVNKTSKDSRLIDYLKKAGLEKNTIDYRSKEVRISDEVVSASLTDFINSSKIYLENSLVNG